MAVAGPFVERTLVTSARRASTFWDRAIVAAVVAVAGGYGRGRLGLERLGPSVGFGVKAMCAGGFRRVIATQVMLGLGVVVGEVSPGAALERDKKMLDALLATRLSSAEIVLGMLAAGLVKSLTCLVGGAAGARLDRVSRGRRSALWCF